MRYQNPENGKVYDIILDGDRIIQESRRIAETIVRNSPFTPNEQRVAERVIIANGDPSLLELLIFKSNPVEAGIRCIDNGGPIITDIEMIRSGINKSALGNNQVLCFLDDPRTKELALNERITRTAAGIRLAEAYLPDSIVAIGNSPTACLELFRLIGCGVKPALVIATPVGFINASESKELILTTGVPCIAIKGTRGGTPSAVAIVNELALMKERK